MKKKLFLFISIFIFALSFNAKAYEFEEDTYYGSYFNLKLLIHKSDEDKNGLEGATFTIKDLNETYSLESYDKSDGDYLIESHLFGGNGGSTMPPSSDEEQPYPQLFDKLYKMMPNEFQDLFNSVSSYDDLETVCRSGKVGCERGYYQYSYYFIVPMIIEETKAPSGYDSGKWVVPAYYYLNVDDGLRAKFEVYIGYDSEFFFEFDESVDYVELFSELYSVDSYEEYLEFLEKNNAIMIEDCYYGDTRREDIEARFSDDELSGSCVMHFTDVKKKESKEDIKVNPATYGTVVVVLILLLGSIGFLATKKLSIKK